MKPNSVVLTVMLFIVLIMPAMLYAQPDFLNDTSDVPIDGGLSLLIAAGVGYGAKKLHNTKNHRSQ